MLDYDVYDVSPSKSQRVGAMEEKLEGVSDYFQALVDRLTNEDEFDDGLIIDAIEEIYSILGIEKDIPDSLCVWRRPRNKQDCLEYFSLSKRLAREQLRNVLNNK